MIERFTLKNATGASMDVLNLGAAIATLRMPDSAGQLHDIVLGYDNPDDYLLNPNHFGVVIGRFANRIAEGEFSLNGTKYQLAKNRNTSHLHGGEQGFHKQLWSASKIHSNNIAFSYLSKHDEENYPGNLNVLVNYCLTDENELIIDYLASTDQPTIINLTQHTYFNLAGHNSGDILNHLIRINSGKFTPVNQNQIPNGEIADVSNTPLDLQAFKRIGDVIKLPHQQLKYCAGLDHNYVLKQQFDSELRLAAEVREPNSNRSMRVITDQPGIQVYSGNFIQEVVGKDSAIYKPHYGLCLETQHFPDTPNHSNFPSAKLLPNQTYKSRTIYQFSMD